MSGIDEPVQAPVVPVRVGWRSFIVARRGARRASAGRRANERIVGLGILGVSLSAFIVVPFFSRDPNALASLPQQPPSGKDWFGTDWLGRDIFSRVFSAGRMDLFITVVGVVICVVLGVLLGLVAAVANRYVRAVIVWLADAFLAIPFVVIVVALVNVVGQRNVLPFLAPSVNALLLAIVLVGWAPYTRLAMAQALAMREREHVVAARLLGYGRIRILLRHIAPAVMGVNMSYGASQAVSTIGLIASLSFLGAGIQEPTPDLGAMMQGGVALLPVAWWITIIPGLFVLLLGIGFALVADSGRR